MKFNHFLKLFLVAVIVLLISEGPLQASSLVTPAVRGGPNQADRTKILETYGQIPFSSGGDGSRVGLDLSGAIPIRSGAGSVFVSEFLSGNVVKVDGSGVKTIFASGLGRPVALKFDKDGNLFVIDSTDFTNVRLLKVTPAGLISTFTRNMPGNYINDLTITDDGKPFILTREEDPSTGEGFAAVWELVEGGAPILLATTVNEAPLGMDARGFTYGPGGHFYLAMQSYNAGGGRIIRVTRTGQVSTFFDPGLPPFASGGGSMLDVRFNSRGEMLILGQVPPGNTRLIWKVQNGVLSTFVSPGVISDGALQLTIDASDNLFVTGGGFGGGGPDGAIQRVDPSGSVTTLATFPTPAEKPFWPIYDIDDDSFDTFLLRADAGGPYSVNEGESVTVTASDSDPEGGSLTYAWDLDNDGSFETPGQSVPFSAATLDGPGSYTIKVQVTDNGGLTATDEATVSVLNLPPTASFANTSGVLIAGQAATLTFSSPVDPSPADMTVGFLYFYDCTNDGAFEPSEPAGTSYTCAYPEGGLFTARGRIQDKDGGFTDYTVEVTVLTPRQGIEGLIEEVRELVGDEGQGNALIAKLEAAIQQLDRGNDHVAINQLEAFIHEVNAILPEDGQPLIDAANAIIASLSS